MGSLKPIELNREIESNTIEASHSLVPNKKYKSFRLRKRANSFTNLRRYIEPSLADETEQSRKSNLPRQQSCAEIRSSMARSRFSRRNDSSMDSTSSGTKRV